MYKKKIRISAKKGFTLIEALLYIGVVTILLVGLSSFVQLVIEARVKNQTIAEVEQQGTQIVQAISQSIRNSSSITSPTAGNSAMSITLANTTTSLNPTTFTLTNGTVLVSEAGGTPVLLSSNRVTVSNLSFQNVTALGTPGTVKFSLTVTYTNNQGKNEYAYTKNFYSSANIR